MIEVIWSSPAFLALEALPFTLALGIFRRAEMLKDFPKMGGPLPMNKKVYAKYRQLVYRKTHRIIYEYDEAENTVYVAAVQNCKQTLATPRELRRQMGNED